MFNTNTVAGHLCSIIEHPCKYQVFGCTAQMGLDAIDAHERVCAERTVKCPFREDTNRGILCLFSTSFRWSCITRKSKSPNTPVTEIRIYFQPKQSLKAQHYIICIPDSIGIKLSQPVTGFYNEQYPAHQCSEWSSLGSRNKSLKVYCLVQLKINSQRFPWTWTPWS